MCVRVNYRESSINKFRIQEQFVISSTRINQSNQISFSTSIFLRYLIVHLLLIFFILPIKILKYVMRTRHTAPPPPVPQSAEVTLATQSDYLFTVGVAIHVGCDMYLTLWIQILVGLVKDYIMGLNNRKSFERSTNPLKDWFSHGN